MPLPGKYSPIDIKPLTGGFDVRSSPDNVPLGLWRYRQNVTVTTPDGNCRRPGWPKLFDNDRYNNEDLHDQLLTLQEYYEERATPYEPQTDIITYPPGESVGSRPKCNVNKKVRGTGRQPITLLYGASTVSGERKLITGTQNRLYALNEGTGNWKILADKYGGQPVTVGLPERRWTAAGLNDVITFTNGTDPVLAWPFDQGTFGCSMQAVTEIPSLKEIGVSSAGVVFAWKGHIFLGDVVMDGERQENLLIWSDFDDAMSWVPSNASVAGAQPLSNNERILAGEALGDVCLIYTTKGIWEMRSIAPNPELFTFRSAYSEPKHGVGCLAYRLTLVSTGAEHLYAGRDGIYRYNSFLPEPERTDWIHAASGIIFDTIEPTRCDSHIACFDPTTKEYWFSWVEKGQSFPLRTLVFNTQYKSDDVVDHGFTAFCTYQRDPRPSTLQWLLDNLLCLESEIDENADLLSARIKEGGFCLEQETPDCTGTQTVILTSDQSTQTPGVACGGLGSDATPLVNAASLSLLTTEQPNSDLEICRNRYLPICTNRGVELDGRLIEDVDGGCDAASLCSYLDKFDLEDLCHECEQAGTFIMASAVDWCLKQAGSVADGPYYREVCIDCTPCGKDAEHREIKDRYFRDGYKTILRTGAIDLSWPRELKQLRSLELQFEAEQQAIPSVVQMRIGVSEQATNPNNEAGCGLIWNSLKPKPLICGTSKSGDQHLKDGTRPDKPLAWPFLYTGKYFYLELLIAGINGACRMSRLSFEARQRPRSASSG